MHTSRRRFLQLSSAAGLLLLPLLRTTRAHAADVLPKRLVFFHTPLGTVRDTWRSTGGGATFTLSPILQPLAPYQKKLLLIDGLKFAPAVNDAGENAGNHHETGTMLTGRVCNGRDELSKHSNISLDQYLRAKMPATVPVKSLEVMTFNSKPSTLRSDRNLFSAKGPDLPVIPEADPQKAFDRVFAGVTGSTGPAVDAQLEAIRARRRSVLDVVGREVSSLQGELTGSERAKLDQHLTAIRELEKRLQAPETSGGMCTVPGRPGVVNPYDNDTLPARLKANMEIVASAMACDLLRVAVIGNENGQGRARPTWLGYSTNWHDAYTHTTTGHDQHTNIQRHFAKIASTSHKEFLINCLNAMGRPETSFGKVSGSPIPDLVA